MTNPWPEGYEVPVPAPAVGSPADGSVPGSGDGSPPSPSDPSSAAASEPVFESVPDPGAPADPVPVPPRVLRAARTAVLAPDAPDSASLLRGFVSCPRVPVDDLPLDHPREFESLRVAPERRCSPFREEDYLPPPARMAAGLPASPARPGQRDPVTCTDASDVSVPRVRFFLVEPEEAHDRGMSERSLVDRHLFGADQMNLAEVAVPAHIPAARAGYPGFWTPSLNDCWYVSARHRVHRAWDLAMPPDEARAMHRIAGRCGPVFGVPSSFVPVCR